MTLYEKVKEMDIDEFVEWLHEFSLECVLTKETIRHQLELNINKEN